MNTSGKRENEKLEYLLGSKASELHRLGVQHYIWAQEAHQGWDRAGFGNGHTILDIGCGPGFCTAELGYRVGTSGRVVGIDIAPAYVDFVKTKIGHHDIKADIIQGDLHDTDIYPSGLDGIWCRWVLAWVADAQKVLANAIAALEPGGAIVLHEYYAWEFFRFEPFRPNLENALKATFRSFNDSHGEVNIGARLPEMLADLGLSVESIRPMVKLARPSDFDWQWPLEFLSGYIPQLRDMEYLTSDQANDAMSELNELTDMQTATCVCPTVAEVIARKK